MKTKLIKIIGIISGSIAGLVLAAFAVYVFLYYPRKAEPFEINTPNPTKTILIAGQGSDFKSSLTTALCDSLKKSSAYIKGIDVGNLGEVNVEDWDRILIISSLIIRVNKDVDRFIARTLTPEKILVLVTSGGADWLPRSDFEVDAFTSASKKVHTNSLVYMITDWMDKDNSQRWKPNDYLLALSYFPRVDVEAACEAITFERERYQALYPSLANMINGIGYQYLRLKDVQSALKIFKLNIGLFPASWNVYDSYGEALLTNGDRESAIKSYRKAVQLNPEAKSANDMLKKLCKD